MRICLFAVTLTVLVCGLSLSGASSAGAQDGSLSAQLVSVSDNGYPNARAIVTVEDTSATAPGALAARDFSVTLGGTPANVLSAELASSTSNPLDVVIVIDTSGSMSGAPITLAKQAAKTFIEQLAPEDRVAVIGFSDEVRLLQDFTADHAAASTVIDTLSAAGNTALYKATAAATLKAGASNASRRAIVLLSDGADYGTNGSTTREQALLAVNNVGAPIFAIGEGTDLDRDYLQQIGTLSNGRYLEAPEPEQLGALYGGIARLLRSQYAVTFDASSAPAGGDADISIGVTSNGRTATASGIYHVPVASAPTVTLEGISAGESLTEARTVTARVSGGAASRVTFSIDGVAVVDVDKAPYTFNYDPAAFPGGAHTLSASATWSGGAVHSDVSFASLAPPRPSSGSGSPMLLIAVGLLIVIVLGAGGAFVVLRMRRKVAVPPGVAQIQAFRSRTPPITVAPPEDAVVAEVVEDPDGVLISRSGSDIGAEYVVGTRPVSIGSGELCAVRVPDRGLSSVEARIWIRTGRLMVHRLTSLNALANDGTMGGWQILEPGDILELGPHKFEFRLLPSPQPLEARDDVPNILRDPEGRRAVDGGAQGAAPATAELSRLRLMELMPKNDVQEPPEPEERAS